MDTPWAAQCNRPPCPPPARTFLSDQLSGKYKIETTGKVSPPWAARCNHLPPLPPAGRGGAPPAAAGSRRRWPQLGGCTAAGGGGMISSRVQTNGGTRIWVHTTGGAQLAARAAVNDLLVQPGDVARRDIIKTQVQGRTCRPRRPRSLAAPARRTPAPGAFIQSGRVNKRPGSEPEQQCKRGHGVAMLVACRPVGPV